MQKMVAAQLPKERVNEVDWEQNDHREESDERVNEVDWEQKDHEEYSPDQIKAHNDKLEALKGITKEMIEEQRQFCDEQSPERVNEVEWEQKDREEISQDQAERNNDELEALKELTRGIIQDELERANDY